MAFSSALVDPNRVSFTVEGEVHYVKTDAQVDNGGITAFENFVEGIVAASRTCNMVASPTIALKHSNLRKSSCLSKNKDVPHEKGTLVREEAKFMKVSALPCSQTLPNIVFFPSTGCLPQIEKFKRQMSWSEPRQSKLGFCRQASAAITSGDRALEGGLGFCRRRLMSARTCAHPRAAAIATSIRQLDLNFGGHDHQPQFINSFIQSCCGAVWLTELGWPSFIHNMHSIKVMSA